MRSENNNIILFPTLKKKLEKESLEALKSKRFETALEKLNKLLTYQVNDYEIITGKLICLMELNRYNEAQELCEKLIQKESDHYYQFLHIYLTILFQTNQFGLLMEQVELELEKGSLPDVYRNQFMQMYEMSEKMKIDIQLQQSNEWIDELQQAISEEEHSKQWQLIEKLKKEKAVPHEETTALLLNPEIHPVVKTALFVWMKEAGVHKKIEVHKFNMKLAISPKDTPDIKEQDTYKQIVFSIRRVEDQNPALYQMIEQILYRYAYVLYPFLPPHHDADYIGEALVQIGTKYLNIHNSPDDTRETAEQKVRDYIETITMCDSLYMSIMEM